MSDLGNHVAKAAEQSHGSEPPSSARGPWKIKYTMHRWAIYRDDGTSHIPMWRASIADAQEACEFENRAWQKRLLEKAAPDMLALLQDLIDIEGPQPGTSEWATKVRAVISKATGVAK